MGSFRFRKQFNIIPGLLKLNVNKQSLSVTAGVRGAHATLNSKGYRTLSAGLPGTGLSYRDTRKLGSKPAALKAAPKAQAAPAADPWKELHNSVVAGTELLLLTNTDHDSPNFFLYADDGTGPETVGIYTDVLSATEDVKRWETYLRSGGTVALWVARTFPEKGTTS